MDTLASRDVAILEFLPNLLLAAVLSHFLSLIYRAFGRSLSNKRTFADTFLPITLTTAMIITILQTNIVLSLGLVGALSIIRFRTAVKEPEELTYIFFCIAVGLGAGAGQRAITAAGFAAVAAILCARGMTRRPDDSRKLLLTVTGPRRLEVERVIEVLEAGCSLADLKRLEDAGETTEAVFVIDLDGMAELTEVRAGLRELDGGIALTFADHRQLT